MGNCPLAAFGRPKGFPAVAKLSSPKGLPAVAAAEVAVVAVVVVAVVTCCNSLKTVPLRKYWAAAAWAGWGGSWTRLGNCTGSW